MNKRRLVVILAVVLVAICVPYKQSAVFRRTTEFLVPAYSTVYVKVFSGVPANAGDGYREYYNPTVEHFRVTTEMSVGIAHSDLEGLDSVPNWPNETLHIETELYLVSILFAYKTKSDAHIWPYYGILNSTNAEIVNVAFTPLVVGHTYVAPLYILDHYYFCVTNPLCTSQKFTLMQETGTGARDTPDPLFASA